MKVHKTKILFFLFGGVGGAERMTITIAKMLPFDKYEVKFVVCGRLNDIYNFIPDDYEVIRIPWYNIYMFPRLRMANVIRKEKPAFVFSSTMKLNLLLIQISRIMNVKCIVRNDNNLEYVSKKMHKKIARQYPFAYRVIAQQEQMQKDLISLVKTNENHIICLHNPIDINTISSKLNETSPYTDKDSVKYLWIGNYLPAKGHDILAEAFKIVHESNPNAHLYFIGKIDEGKPAYQKVKNYVNENGLQEYVHFVDFQQNPYVWMKYCDCFVLPSRMEGLPNSLLEAMYIGKPVVASACIPIIDRIVKDGYNGYKVVPEHPVEMAEAMVRALSLKDFKMTYLPAQKQDFINIFEH